LLHVTSLFVTAFCFYIYKLTHFLILHITVSAHFDRSKTNSYSYLKNFRKQLDICIILQQVVIVCQMCTTRGPRVSINAEISCLEVVYSGEIWSVRNTSWTEVVIDVIMKPKWALLVLLPIAVFLFLLIMTE